MKKEIYFWALFFIAVAAAAVYIRYYYQPAIGVSVTFAVNPSSLGKVYQFQELRLPVNVSNIGSVAFKNLSVSILINGNLSSVYLVTMPPGKEATLYYNFTPENAGMYNISAVADLGKVYNVQNRQKAISTIGIYVNAPEQAAAYALLPPGALNFSSAQGSIAGLMAAEYMSSAYGVGIPGMFSAPFVSRLINITANYIRNVSLADTYYANGSRAYSLWISGFLNPSVIGIAANASGLSYSTAAVAGNNVTVVRLGSNATLCSWYSEGWLKTLSYYGNGSCTGIIASKYNTTYASNTMNDFATTLYKAYNSSYEQLRYEWYGVNKSMSSASVMLINRSVVAMPGISTAVQTNSTKCFGIISFVNGTYYCSSYVLPLNGSISSISLVRTTATIGNRNLSVYSFVNTSKVIGSVPVNIQLLSMLGIHGKSLNFTSPFSSYCSIGNASAIQCSNPSIYYSNLSMELKNILSSSIKINGATCYYQLPGKSAMLNATILPGNTMSISLPCYEGNSKLSGLPLNLDLTLLLNYTYNGSIEHVAGTAVINSLG